MDLIYVLILAAVALAFIGGVWVGVALHAHWLNRAIDTGTLETGNGEAYRLTKRRKRRG